jgi:hypothetical protein
MRRMIADDEGVTGDDRKPIAQQLRSNLGPAPALRQPQPEMMRGRFGQELKTFQRALCELLTADRLVADRGDDAFRNTSLEPMGDEGDH